MNKLLLVCILAIASCALAGKKFYPKKLGCSYFGDMNMTMYAVLKTKGHLYTKSNGDSYFSRLDVIYEGFTEYTDIKRCDVKDGKGYCLEHIFGPEVACTDVYIPHPVNQYESAFDYETTATVGCPDGIGECVEYCDEDTRLCMTVDGEKEIVGIRSLNKSAADYSETTVEWDRKKEFSMNKFAFDLCNGTKLPVPVDPCGNLYSSSAQPASSSSVPPKPSQSSPSSMVMASFVLVVAALLAALV